MQFVSEKPSLMREALLTARVRPDFAMGLRAAIATVVPLLLVPVWGHPMLTWAGLAGFNATLCDKGGPYRTRALSMAGYALGGAAVAVLGGYASNSAIASVALVLVLVAACGFLRVFGAEATAVGVTIAATLVFSLALKVTSPVEPLWRGVGTLAGGAWAMAFVLLLWPIRFFRPSRVAVAEVLDALASYTSLLGEVSDPESAHWQAQRRERSLKVRESIERARGVVSRLRRGRSGSSDRGEQLVVLLETADQLFALAVALGESILRGVPAEVVQHRETANGLSASLQRLSACVLEEKPTPPLDGPASTSCTGGLGSRVREELEEMEQAAAALQGATKQQPHNARSPLVRPPSSWETIRGNLTLDSVIARHAVRLSLSTAVTVLVASAVHIGHAYWASITCLIILQPHGTATFARAMQRVMGTVLGAGLALLIAFTLKDSQWLMGAIFLLATVSVALLPLNYGLYSIFLTPTFVLLAESSSRDWGLVEVRILNTVLGAALALAGARLILPISERDRFPAQMAAALQGVRKLANVALASAFPIEELHAARSQVGVELLNAEAAFQRLLTESRTAPEETEALVTLLLYTHRVVAGLIAFAVTVPEAERTSAALASSRERINAVLADLERSISVGAAPLPLALEPDAAQAHGTQAQVLLQQLSVQHAAVARWHQARLTA